MSSVPPLRSGEPHRQAGGEAAESFARALSGAAGVDVIGAVVAASCVPGGPDSDARRCEAIELIEGLAERLTRRLRAHGALAEALTGALLLSRFLSEEAGFSGRDVVPGDPAGLDLVEVLRQRRGLPPALCLVHVEVGRRAGLPLHVATFPVRWLACLAVPPRPLLFDPWREGRIVLPEEVLGLCAPPREGAQRPEPRGRHLEPCAPERFLTRWLLALRHARERQGDLGGAAAAHAHLVQLRPCDVALRAESAVLLARAGRLPDARAELDRAELLAVDPDGRALIRRERFRLDSQSGHHS